MFLNLRRAIAGTGVAVAMLLVGAVPAHAANMLNATYYTISTSDPLFDHMCCDTVNDEVLGNLGQHGLPVLNPATVLPSGHRPSGFDLWAPTNEITWWSPALNQHYVTQTGTGTVSLPFHDNMFYPPDGTGSDDNQGGLAAHFYGSLFAPIPEEISFSIGADDSAFVYLDGKLVCDLGGVHPTAPGTCTSESIGAGNHKLDLFFVDMNKTGSELNFSVETEGVKISAAPEPAVWAMLLIGFGLIGMAMRRRTALGAA